MKNRTMKKSLVHMLLPVLAAFYFTPAHAGIVYTDIPDATLSDGGSIAINFDGAGAAEFTFQDVGFEMVQAGVFLTADSHLATVSTTEWDVIKGLLVNTAINAAGGWFDQGDAYVDPGWATTHFPAGADTYIGAKFKLGANIYYGWIRVNWNVNGTFIVKSYAYNNVANGSILAGDTGNTASIEERVADESFLIVPNPATDHIAIRNFPPASTHLKIQSVSGKVIYEGAVTDQDASVGISHFPAGTYFVFLSDGNGATVSQVFVKQ